MSFFVDCFTTFRGRPFDIHCVCGGGADLFSQRNPVSGFARRNNLALKGVKKPVLKNYNKNKFWLTIKGKPPFYLIFVECPLYIH